MPPRRRKRKTRRSRSFSLINALEAYTYASILSEGVAGTSPWGMITGDTDLGYTTTTTGMGIHSKEIQTQTGAGEISLGDIVSQPAQALGVMSQNLQNNLVPMAVASLITGVSFRLGKRILRRPLSNINRNIMKPLLGAGIKL